jgi:hypothetical protein
MEKVPVKPWLGRVDRARAMFGGSYFERPSPVTTTSALWLVRMP